MVPIKEGYAMTREIVNLTQLAEMCGRSRERIKRLVDDERIRSDYVVKVKPKKIGSDKTTTIDSSYWTPSHARKIARVIKAHEKSGKSGPGSRMQIEKPRRAKKGE